MRENTQKVLEYKDILQQEVNQLKAEAEQQNVEQIQDGASAAKEYTSTEQQTAPSETIFSRSVFEREAEEKQEQKERLLEARIQNLTENNDALERDNNLLQRENEFNNGWVNNQEELMKSLDEALKVQTE